MLAFHDQQPRFESWKVDYQFAAGAGNSDHSDGIGGEAKVPADRLPPEIQVDLHLRKAEQAMRDGDAATAREAMERVAALPGSQRMAAQIPARAAGVRLSHLLAILE